MFSSHRQSRAIRRAVQACRWQFEILEQRMLLSGTTNLVFDDEFNQAVGTAPNPTTWQYNTGTDPNNGAVDYTDNSSTMSIVADSGATDGKALALTLTPVSGGFDSARITTAIDPIGDNLEYGSVSARIKMPSATNAAGVWPAFWMLGSDINSGVGWPECGETDIVEMKGSTPSTAQGSLHAGSSVGQTNYDPTATYNVGSALSAAYHVFAVNWTPTSIAFSVDGHVYETQSLSNVPTADKTPFNKPFYITLNVCEGGSFAGGTNGTQYTVTAPTTMYVDYVRAASYNLPASPALSDADIGSPGVAGSSSFDGAGWTVAGSGSDIFGTSDQFNFDSQTLTGDGSITAEVTGITNSASFAKAGVMIRDGTAASADYAFTFVNPNDGVSGEGVNYEYRAVAGGESASDNSTAGVTAPEWVRLVRAGNTFTAYDSADGLTWTQNGAPVSITMGSSVNVGLAVSANTNSALDTATFTHVSILAGAMTDSDIGATDGPGSASYNASTAVYTVTGAGADIWNTADQFNFASQNLSGDGSVTAEVTGLGNTNAWAKAGVMLRSDSTAGSIFANVDVTPSEGVTFQYRSTINAIPTAVTIAGIAAPVWVRVTRAGSSYSGYYSTNGTSWTQIGTTQTLSMGTTTLAGLAVTSHDSTALTQATFTNVSIVNPAFAALSGGVLSLTFDTGADPISLAASGSSVSATMGNTTLNFTGVTAVDAVYAAAGGTLSIGGNLTGPITLAGTSSAGVLVLAASASAALGAPALNAGITAEQLEQLSIGSGAVLTVASPYDPADRAVLVLGGLTITGSKGNWQGLLNLTSNDMILLGSNPGGMTLSTTTDQLTAGCAGGGWTGTTGIVSSTAASELVAAEGSSAVQPMALGVIVNAGSNGTALYSASNGRGAFDGQSPGAGAILVKYTPVGDADLSGSVTLADYLAIDAGYAIAGSSGWGNGDFNYDGVINGDDYSLIDNSFNIENALTADAAIANSFLAAPAEIVATPPVGTRTGVAAALAAALPSKRGAFVPASPAPRASVVFADDVAIGASAAPPVTVAGTLFDSDDTLSF